MSAINDALAALKNVVLMQERLDVMRGELARTAGDLKTLTEKTHAIDRRVLRIETMVEMSTRRSEQPRIEE